MQRNNKGEQNPRGFFPRTAVKKVFPKITPTEYHPAPTKSTMIKDTQCSSADLICL